MEVACRWPVGRGGVTGRLVRRGTVAMVFWPGLARFRSVCVLAVLLVGGCGTGAAPVTPTAQAAPVNGAFTIGTVVSVRRVDIAGGGQAGVDAVLAALQEPPAAAGGDQASVLRRAAASATSIVVAAPGFAVGDQVVLTAGPDGAVLRRN